MVALCIENITEGINMKKNYTIVCLVVLLVLFSTVFLLAQVPRTMNYQAKITAAEGVALNGTYIIQFNLYNTGTAGTPLWTETRSVDVVNGLFDIQLGEVNPFGLDFSEGFRWT